MESRRPRTNACVASEETFCPVITTRRVLFGTVLANWLEIRASAFADSSWLPLAEPSCREVDFPTFTTMGRTATKAMIQATMMYFLRL
jgi:hypothetical protein